MERHERVVLEERVRTAAVVRWERETHERVGGWRRHEQQEEREHGEEHREGGRGEAGEGPGAAERHVRRRAGEDARPEEDRSFERGPQRDQAVEERRLARVVLRDVEDREVVRRERGHHRQSGDRDESERRRRGEPRRRERARVTLPRGVGR